jgi:nicotinamidase-related amidase
MDQRTDDPDVRQMMKDLTTFQGAALDPHRAALLVIDMVNWQVPRALTDSPTATEYFVRRLEELTIPTLARLVPACRKLGVRIAWLRVGSAQTDYADAPAVLRGLFAGAAARDGTPACAVISELAPEAGDLDLLKPGSGAFIVTDLDAQLRAAGVVNLLYAGVVTNACVMSTLSAGFDLGYTNYLVTDATAALSQQLQDETEHLIGSFMAELVSSQSVVERLQRASTHVSG